MHTATIYQHGSQVPFMAGHEQPKETGEYIETFATGRKRSDQYLRESTYGSC